MRERILYIVLAASMALAACGSPAPTQTMAAPGMEEAFPTESEARTTGEREDRGITEAEAEASGEPHKVGIVIPTLTASEDEFRSAQEMVQGYSDLVVRRTLPKNFTTDKEGCVPVVTSLADDPEMRYTLFNNRMEGIVLIFQTTREKRSGIVTMATSSDDPELLNNYTDISINADWIRRGETIPTKTHDMGAKTFVHYFFSTHIAAESKAKGRDVVKETREKLGMAQVKETTPDPQTSNGTATMPRFLREDIPRKIEQYGPDINIFGANCPIYGMILDEAFKGKFTVAEQCCPTPTQACPTVFNLEIAEGDLGNCSKIDNLITGRAWEAGISGRLSGWTTPSSVYTPQLQVKPTKYIHNDNLSPRDVLGRELLNQFTSEHMSAVADFQATDEGLGRYYMLLLEDIYYWGVGRL